MRRITTNSPKTLLGKGTLQGCSHPWPLSKTWARWRHFVQAEYPISKW